jgi:hypothetical protein
VSCKIYSRVFSTLFLSAMTTIAILTSFAIADEVKMQTDKFRIFKQAYIDSAFGNGNKLLVKFDTRSSIKVSYKCTAQIRLKCVIFSGTFTDVFKDAILGAKRLKIEFDIQNPQFEVIASDVSSLEEYKASYSKVFENKYLDSSDLECQLYYELDSTLNLITRAAIIVSVESPLRKNIFCIATQIRRAVGLVAHDRLTFSDIWTSDPALPKASQQWFEQFVLSYTMLDLVHMCAELKPGMNLAEVNVELVPSSSCFWFIKRF